MRKTRRVPKDVLAQGVPFCTSLQDKAFESGNPVEPCAINLTLKLQRTLKSRGWGGGGRGSDGGGGGIP